MTAPDLAAMRRLLENEAHLAVLSKDDLRALLAAAEERDGLRKERDEALAANAAAVCAWQEYGRWPEQYGAVPIGRYRTPDGKEHEIALRADQITGITRGIMRHIESILPSGLKMLEAWQNESSLKSRAESAEAKLAEERKNWNELVLLIARSFDPECKEATWGDIAEQFDPWATVRSVEAKLAEAEARGYARMKLEAAAENGRLNTLRCAAESRAERLEAAVKSLLTVLPSGRCVACGTEPKAECLSNCAVLHIMGLLPRARCERCCRSERPGSLWVEGGTHGQWIDCPDCVYIETASALAPPPAAPKPAPCATCGDFKPGSYQEHQLGCRYRHDEEMCNVFNPDFGCSNCVPERKPCPACGGRR